MLNNIPVVGWIIDFILKTSMAVPFYTVWTMFGMGAKYFSFLPAVYLSPSFWDCVGVFIVVAIIKYVFVPTIVSMTQTNNDSGK